jgi:hypothetical protein
MSATGYECIFVPACFAIGRALPIAEQPRDRSQRRKVEKGRT